MKFAIVLSNIPTELGKASQKHNATGEYMNLEPEKVIWDLNLIYLDSKEGCIILKRDVLCHYGIEQKAEERKR